MKYLYLLSSRELAIYLRNVDEAKRRLQDRQEFPRPEQEQLKERQKTSKRRGRPRKFDVEKLLAQYDDACLGSDWGEPTPTIAEFCRQHGISPSLFRELRRKHRKEGGSNEA